MRVGHQIGIAGSTTDPGSNGVGGVQSSFQFLAITEDPSSLFDDPILHSLAQPAACRGTDDAPRGPSRTLARTLDANLKGRRADIPDAHAKR